ncbi:hypothetical protein GCM10029976_066650 [Kribbella albertanoniae]|uniref:Uncharacterized protein n=1 Tax=Kribbella albertanoniae TaxID=1266829 RepID=A0A4R4QIZ7_9ACTN|nr:hypothetical protein [Kribbella albertanoniae]TDC35781.1 hypothetical protein E1261_00180 [Kribbella albertanoniae]
MTSSSALGGRRTVRVWFGQHIIAMYTAEPALAARYESAMRSRFAGLRVTNQLVGTTAVAPQAGDKG